jgi:hypothetical protein
MVVNKETKIKNLLGRANKKTIILVSIAIILVLVLGLGVLAANWKIKNGFCVGNFNISKPGQDDSTQNSNFLPQQSAPRDAAKTGELAIVVDNLDSAKNSITEVAAKNGGSIYTTYIAYSSAKIKNGSIVVQIPAENFDVAMTDLKNISNRIVQESTRQIPINNPSIYNPQPLSIPVSDKDDSNKSNSPAATDNKNVADKTTEQSSIAPMPIYNQVVQNKAYIKVVFADYGTVGNDVRANQGGVANVIGIGYTGQNMRNNPWVILAIKSILLIVLLIVLFIIGKKITQNIKRLKKNKSEIIHRVKQSPRSRARIIRIKKK